MSMFSYSKTKCAPVFLYLWFLFDFIYLFILFIYSLEGRDGRAALQ